MTPARWLAERVADWRLRRALAADPLAASLRRLPAFWDDPAAALRRAREIRAHPPEQRLAVAQELFRHGLGVAAVRALFTDPPEMT